MLESISAKLMNQNMYKYVKDDDQQKPLSNFYSQANLDEASETKQNPILKILNIILFLLVLAILVVYLQPINKQDPNSVYKQQLLQIMQYIPKKVAYDLKREYFYFRLHLWSHQKQIIQAQKHKYQLQYPQKLFSKHNSIGILIDGRQFQEQDIIKLIQSIIVQDYDAYHIVLYMKQQNLSQKLNIFSKIPISISYTQKQTLDLCKKYDIIFTTTITGQLIGRKVLKRINKILTSNGAQKLLINSVLSFSQKQKIPVKRGSPSLNINSDQNSQLIFGEYSLAFKTSQFLHIFQAEYKCTVNLSKNMIIKLVQDDKISENVQKVLYDVSYDVYSEVQLNGHEIQKLINCAQKKIINHQDISEKIDKYQSLHKKKLIQINREVVDKQNQYLRRKPEWQHMWYHIIYSNIAYKPISLTYAAYRQYLDQDNPQILQFDYDYLDNKYSIGGYEKQLSICLVSCGRNLVLDQFYRMYVQFIGRQNYTNFKAFYIDDFSDDDSVIKAEEHMFLEYPYVKRKLTIVANQVRQQNVGSRLIGYKKCQPGDIIIDCDADDELIGAQVLQLYNTIYQKNADLWFLYTKPLLVNKYRTINRGLSKIIPKSYYQKHVLPLRDFAISALRSFRYELVDKINKEDLIDPRIDRYFQKLGDLVFYNFIAELSGTQRTLFVDETLYFYTTRTTFTQIKQKKQESYFIRKINPYMQLESLDSPSEKTHAANQKQQLQQLESYTLKIIKNQQALANKVYQVSKTNKMLQKKLQYQTPEYISQNYMASNQDLKRKMSIANLFYGNNVVKEIFLERYYYDTRNFILKYPGQISILLYAQVRNLQNFNNFISSIFFQDYLNFNIVFVCSSYQQSAFIREMLSTISIILLQKSYFFINTSQYIEQYLRQIMYQETIILELSTDKSLIGTQAFRLISCIFQQNIDKHIIAFPQMIEKQDDKWLLSELSEQELRNRLRKNNAKRQTYYTIASRYFANRQGHDIKDEEVYIKNEIIVKAEYPRMLKQNQQTTA